MLTALLLAVLPASQAAGYYTTDIGTRGMSRGGAYIAGNRDLSAQFYNPAALINLKRPQAYINWSMVDQSVDFTRVDLDDSGKIAKTYDTVHNIAKPMQIPAFGVAHNFGLKNTMFAIGMFPPFAPDMEYPKKGAQRYTLIDSLIWEVNAGPSVAYKPLPWLTVGGSFLWNLVRAEETLNANVCNALITAGTEPNSSCGNYTADEVDLTVDLRMMDKSTFTGNFGLLIEPRDDVKIGLSIEPPMKVEGKGSLQAEFSENHWLTQFLDDTKTRDGDVLVTLNMPLIARLGVAVNPTKSWQVEVASVYERWQVTEEIRVTDLHLELQPVNPLAGDDDPALDPLVIDDDVILPADYVDTFSYRLGTEYDIGEVASIRAGGWYELSAIPPETQGVNLIDGNKFGYGLGGSYHWKKHLSLDVGFAQSFISERKIRDSSVKQLQIPLELDLAKILANEPMEANLGQGDTVGNGNFSARTTMMSAGLTVYFGKEVKAPGQWGQK